MLLRLLLLLLLRLLLLPLRLLLLLLTVVPLLQQPQRCCCGALLLWLLGLLPLLLRLLMFVKLPQIVRLLLHLLHRLHAHRPLNRARTVARIWGRVFAWIGAVATHPVVALVHFPVVDLMLGVVVTTRLHAAWLAQVRRALLHPADAIRLLVAAAQLATAGAPRAIP